MQYRTQLGRCPVCHPGAWPDIPRSQAGDWTMSCLPPLYLASDGGPAVSGASEGTRFHQLGAGLLREFLASVRVEMLPIVNKCIIFFIAEKMIQFTRQNTVQIMVLVCLYSFVCWPLKVSKYPVQSRVPDPVLVLQTAGLGELGREKSRAAVT